MPCTLLRKPTESWEKRLHSNWFLAEDRWWLLSFGKGQRYEYMIGRVAQHFGCVSEGRDQTKIANGTLWEKYVFLGKSNTYRDGTSYECKYRKLYYKEAWIWWLEISCGISVPLLPRSGGKGYIVILHDLGVIRPCIRCMGPFANVVQMNCSPPRVKMDTEEVKWKWKRIMMESREKTGVYAGLERKYWMKCAKEVFLELSMAKQSSFLEAENFKANRELLDMY